jgi:hypothetical protein
VASFSALSRHNDQVVVKLAHLRWRHCRTCSGRFPEGGANAQRQDSDVGAQRIHRRAFAFTPLAAPGGSGGIERAICCLSPARTERVALRRASADKRAATATGDRKNCCAAWRMLSLSRYATAPVWAAASSSSLQACKRRLAWADEQRRKKYLNFALSFLAARMRAQAWRRLRLIVSWCWRFTHP